MTLLSRVSLLSELANAWQGISCSDYPRLGRSFWEMAQPGAGWVLLQSTVEDPIEFGGRSEVLFWEDGNGAMTEVCQEGAAFRGVSAWNKPGVVVSQMGPLPVTLYQGTKFDGNCSVITPFDPAHALPIWVFCRSIEYAKAVRSLNQKLNVTNSTLVKVPFDLARWQSVAAVEYPNGLPEPHSDDPTQWLFHGHPAVADASVALQVAVARLVGYLWPTELDPDMPLSVAARATVAKCKHLSGFADDDGVVPLVPMRGEPAAEGRVRDLLRAAFGGEWSSAKEATLLAAAAGDKAPAPSLDDWLRNRLFAEHCSLFHNRPFVWHIWDGRKKDGFGVLVHYHRLAAPNGEGRRLLEKITHGYLGDWISRQRDEMKANKPGADARLAAALDLQKKLEAILAGEPPYDIFVRWKPLHEQSIGWEPDINDGVRMNIRPFIEAGVLRDKVNVKWTKDRGQEPQAIRAKADFPWFWNGSTFSGDRVNDVHLSVAVKQKAREAKGKA